MAEFILSAVNNTNPDPETDQRGCYKRGDILAVMEDGWSWGTRELIPPIDGGIFVRVRITGVSVAQVQNFAFNKLGFKLSRPFTADAGTGLLMIPDPIAPNGLLVRVRSTDILPSPFVSTQDYYIRDSTGATFALAATRGGAPIVATSTGVGTHEVGIPYRIAEEEWNVADLVTAPIPVTRRRVHLTVDLLPPAVLQQLNQTGFYENTWANIRAYVRDKVAGSVF